MPSLDRYEEKWYRRTKNAIEKMLKNLKSDAAYNDLISGLADIEGMPPESDIRNSIAIKNWKGEINKLTFEKLITIVEKSHEKKTWAAGLKEAFMPEE